MLVEQSVEYSALLTLSSLVYTLLPNFIYLLSLRTYDTPSCGISPPPLPPCTSAFLPILTQQSIQTLEHTLVYTYTSIIEVSHSYYLHPELFSRTVKSGTAYTLRGWGTQHDIAAYRRSNFRIALE